MKKDSLLFVATGVALTAGGCVGCMAPTAKIAPTKTTRASTRVPVPKVTADNFVSLTYDVSGGFIGASSQLVLET